MLSSTSLILFIFGYFIFLFTLSRLLAPKKEHQNLAFFNSQKSANWIFVSIGMIGTTLSGITFISVPGIVGENQHSYFQFILGNALGFVFIALLLLPIFYKYKVISIYEYLYHRFDVKCQKWASAYFILSRLLGSGLRFYLAMVILQKFIFEPLDVPFVLTCLISLTMIWLYTYKGGLKTIIITDLFQTAFIISSVLCSIYFINNAIGGSLWDNISNLIRSNQSQIFFFNSIHDNPNHFVKLFTGGFFITVCMVGLDQDIMQKNLSVSNYHKSKKNMFVFTLIFIFMNLFFLYLGSMLYTYASKFNISYGSNSDYLFPTILLNHLTPIASVLFMLGLTSSTFATTDSALTALTTSFCVDILKFNDNKSTVEKYRTFVHLSFCFLVLIISVILYAMESKQIVYVLFKVASYTYGPLLGLFSLGLLTKREYKGKYIFPLTFSPPIITYLIVTYLQHQNIYNAGYELILYNGGLTFLFLYLFSTKPKPTLV